MNEWREYKLGDLADIQTGPFGSQLHASDYVSLGIPSIMPTNIGARLNLNRENMVFIKKSDASRLAKYLVEQGDIVYSRRGDVEKCAFITQNEEGWLCGTGCLIVRINAQSLSPKFCAYYLSTDEIKGWVSSNAVGTTMPNLNTGILQRLPLLIPPLPEQKAIASILSSLDDKIDLLHRQNATLEVMAETLFRQWFVENQTDEVVEIGEYAVNIRVNAKVNSLKNYEHYVGLEHIPRKSISLVNWGKPEELGSNKSVFKSDDILFGKLRSYFHKVVFAPICGVCSTDILVIRPKKAKWFSFCLFWFCSTDVVEYSDLGSGGTRMPRTNWEILSKYKIPKPDIGKVEEFDDIVRPMIAKIKINIKQIHSLTTLRDTLLPKLMSGDIRVIV